MRRLRLIVSAAVLSIASRVFAQPAITPYAWQNVKIVAGGFITGIYFSPLEKDLATIASFLPPDAAPQLVDQFTGLAEEVAFKINAIECSLL